MLNKSSMLFPSASARDLNAKTTSAHDPSYSDKDKFAARCRPLFAVSSAFLSLSSKPTRRCSITATLPLRSSNSDVSLTSSKLTCAVFRIPSSCCFVVQQDAHALLDFSCKSSDDNFAASIASLLEATSAAHTSGSTPSNASSEVASANVMASVLSAINASRCSLATFSICPLTSVRAMPTAILNWSKASILHPASSYGLVCLTILRKFSSGKSKSYSPLAKAVRSSIERMPSAFESYFTNICSFFRCWRFAAVFWQIAILYSFPFWNASAVRRVATLIRGRRLAIWALASSSMDFALSMIGFLMPMKSAHDEQAAIASLPCL
mmetsp:Transcript_5605/g.9131  ORF Transcript_5605/g.9131 Transcript_5605/m.9131 type:complete len:323 (-) Transcript_5605:2019-2987(-)